MEDPDVMLEEKVALSRHNRVAAKVSLLLGSQRYPGAATIQPRPGVNTEPTLLACHLKNATLLSLPATSLKLHQLPRLMLCLSVLRRLQAGR